MKGKKTSGELIEEVIDNTIDIAWSTKDSEDIASEIVWEKLTLRQEQFCRLYATEKEFFGNWVQAYLEVYDIDTTKKWWYDTARVCASQLLTNPNVYNRINDLLDEQGLNDSFVDKQLLFLLSQQDDKWSKLWAIKEYNKLKQRITDKIEMDATVQIANIDIV